jgi:DNA-binding beta-propeller fold protein YncE
MIIFKALLKRSLTLTPLLVLTAFSFPAGSAQAASQSLCALPLSAPPAVSGCVFAGEGPGAGQVARPEGVAVNQSSGDVYVTDSGEGAELNERVDEFNREGGFIRAWGWGVLNNKEEFQTCTTATTCKEVPPSLRGSGDGQFFDPVSVAVDNSTELSGGDVYVTDEFNFRVQEFDEAGRFILMFGKEVNKTTHENICTAASHDECGAGVRGTGPGQFDTGDNPVAVDGGGDVWVGDEERLEEFSSAGVLIGEVPLTGKGTITSLVVNAAGTDFYVMSTGDPGVREYESLGLEVVGFKPLDETGHPKAFAVDPETGDLFVSDQVEEGSPATLLEFSPGGVELESFAAGRVIGKPEGNALAYGQSAKALYVVSHDGGSSLATAQAFAVPPLGPLVKAGSLVAKPLRVTTATLNATVNPENVETKYHFDYIAQAAYELNVTESKPPFAGASETAEGALLAGAFAEDPVSTAVKGLKPETGYRFCLAAEDIEHKTGNATCSSGEDEGTFTTLPGAEISEQAASKVTASSALLQAVVNPLGSATEYQFEYLTEAEYQANLSAGREPFTGAVPVPSPAASVGSQEEGHPVSENAQGLSASTTYRYRLVARNHCNPAARDDVCTSSGPALAFTTQRSGGELVLPDGRQWEMVSPPDKHGAQLQSINEDSVVQAAMQGNAITYVASGSTGERVAGNDRLSQLLSTRGGAGSPSWSTQDIAVSHGGATEAAAGGGQDYLWFSEDLSVAAVEPAGPFSPFLSPSASEQTAYLRNDMTGAFTPLVSGCPGGGKPCPAPTQEHADVPPGTVFGEQGQKREDGPQFVGATADGSHVVLYSAVALTETALPPVEGGNGPEPGRGLYEWSGGRLSLVSVLPQTAEQHAKDEEGTPASLPTLGVGSPLREGQAASDGVSKRGAISSDGSRVVFTEQQDGTPVALYMRDLAAGQTIQLDAAEAGCPHTECKGGGGIFQLATEASGVERVLFTDEHQLMAHAGGGALYECEIVAGPGGAECRLSDLTPRPSDEESPAVQGSVIGATPDGSTLYLVAEAVLTRTPDAGGETAQPGGDDLYAWHDGTASLVAVLSGEDFPDWGGPSEANNELYRLTARMSPDGQYLAFMSDRSLTGYDNHDAHSGQLDEEVFEYDAQTGRTSCVSCNPTGARPTGKEAVQGGTLAIAERVWPTGRGLAANVPGWTAYASSRALFQPRYLSNGGRLFFNSSDALVPQDINGTEDVYEYEPLGYQNGEGTTECSDASSAATGLLYVPAESGCVGLISSGGSTEESGFLDASESGGDVFFLTAAKLSPQDYDTSLDVYDAHECTAASPCAPPSAGQSPECVTAEACRAAPTPEPSIYGPPSSATFNGQGDVTQAPASSTKPKPLTRAEKLKAALTKCHRDKNKTKRQACERGVRKQYGPVKKSKKRK